MFRPDEHLIVASASGVHVTDIKGTEFLDLNSGLWHVPLGYDLSKLVQAGKDALDELTATALFRRIHLPALDLVQRLSARLPSKRFFLGCSGSDAVDTALRIALAYGITHAHPKTSFASIAGCYHGVTLADMSLIGLEGYANGVPKMLSHVLLPSPAGPEEQWMPSLESLFSQHRDDLAAVFVELIQGSGGIVRIPDRYLEYLRIQCAAHDILLVIDEVATGVYRTGPFVAQTDAGVTADITLLGKSIAAGMAPLSIVAVSDEIFARLTSEEKAHRLAGFTQGGHPVACAIAVKLLEYTETTEFSAQHEASTVALAGCLPQLREHPAVADVSGLGHMYGVRLTGELMERLDDGPGYIRQVTMAALAERILIHPLASGVIPLMPSINTPPHLVTEMISRLLSVLDKLS